LFAWKEENIDLLPLVLQYSLLFGKIVLNLESHLHCMVTFVCFWTCCRNEFDFKLYQFLNWKTFIQQNF